MSSFAKGKAVYLHARSHMLIKVVDWRLAHIYMRERENNQIIGMTKEIGQSFLSLNIIYVLSVGHKSLMYVVKSVRTSLFIYFNLQ